MMSSKRDVICRDLHALEPTDIQAFIDSLSIVERHRVCRVLNGCLGRSPYHFYGCIIHPFDIEMLEYLNWYVNK
jgi:hypothetical protein